MRVDEKGGQYQGYVAEIENVNKYVREFIGGDIETVNLTNEIVIICKEDAVVLGSPLNRAMYRAGNLITIFSGNIMAVRQTSAGYTDLCDADIEVVESCMKPIARIYDGRVFTKSASELYRWGIV